MRHLSKVKSFYSYSNFENVIHGFIAIPLDYCNALYVCVSHANFHSSNWVKMLLLACLPEPVTWSVSPLSWPSLLPSGFYCMFLKPLMGWHHHTA